MEVDGKTPGLLPPKRVRRVLEEANQHGVAASLLMTADGSLLGAAGFDTLSVGGARAAPRLEPHTLGAIAAVLGCAIGCGSTTRQRRCIESARSLGSGRCRKKMPARSEWGQISGAATGGSCERQAAKTSR